MRKEFNNLVKQLHLKLFSEEYDFMFDSSSDIRDRRNGKNPMNNDYIERMNNKRIKLGFLPLSENGYPQDQNDTIEYCKKLITNEIEKN